MREEELRAIVREVVRRHVRPRPASPSRLVSLTDHPSHARFGLQSGTDADGPCLIEPAVGCVHCGFCQSRGY